MILSPQIVHNLITNSTKSRWGLQTTSETTSNQYSNSFKKLIQSSSSSSFIIADIISSMDLFNFHWKWSKTLFIFVNYASTFDNYTDLFTRSGHLTRNLLTTTTNLCSNSFKANVISENQAWLHSANHSPHNYLVAPTIAFINSFLGWTHLVPTITIWKMLVCK